MKEKKRINTKIGVGYVVKAKDGDMDDNKREGISRRTRKEVVGYVQDVVETKTLLVQFKYGQKKDMSSSLIMFLCLKEEVDMDENNQTFLKNKKVNC